MPSSQIKDLLNGIGQEIENEDWDLYRPASLYEPIKYMLSLGGKRIRPSLVMMGSEMYNGDAKLAMPVALAVEYFHNFTLIHDDIMDESTVRRGKSTVHTKFGQNSAILSGDVLYTLALEKFCVLPSTLQSNLIKRFLQTAKEVCEGQQKDMDLEVSENFVLSDYLEMIRDKTAVLLGYSLEAGAMVGGAPMMDAKKLFRIGEQAGIAFQLMDDYLDTFGDSQKTGKRKGGDIISNKKTALYIHTYNSASPEDKRLMDQFQQEGFVGQEEKVKEMTQLFEKYGADKACKELEDNYFNSAFQLLEQIEANKEAKDQLKELFEMLKNRDR